MTDHAGRRYVIKRGDKTGSYEWEIVVVDTNTNLVVGSFALGPHEYRQQQAVALQTILERGEHQ